MVEQQFSLKSFQPTNKIEGSKCEWLPDPLSDQSGWNLNPESRSLLFTVFGRF